MPEPRAIGDQTWKMRFLRRRALVCDAKLGGLGAAATRAAAEGSSMAPRQFLVRRCCFDSFSLRGLFFFLKAWTRWKEEEKHKRGQLVLAVKIIRRGNFIGDFFIQTIIKVSNSFSAIEILAVPPQSLAQSFLVPCATSVRLQSDGR